MTNAERIEHIELKRAELKQKIKDEAARRFPNEVALRRMKAENCRMKDQLVALSAPPETSAAVA